MRKTDTALSSDVFQVQQTASNKATAAGTSETETGALATSSDAGTSSFSWYTTTTGVEILVENRSGVGHGHRNRP